jgi:nucleotide-binding universal stress UspA family protein
MTATSFDSMSGSSRELRDATGVSTQASRPLNLAGRAVLLATDGSPSAVAGARVAFALAQKYHAVIHVVSVVDTRSAPIPPPLDMALAMGDALAGSELHREQERSVRAELSGAIGDPLDWPVRVRLGAPASAIVQEAQHVGAVLIIVGLRRHGRIDRAVHDETALNVMRVASCPVLGAVAEMDGLPTRVLAAVDFSEGSLVAVRTARAVLGDGAVLVLAYVQPMNAFLSDEGEAAIHELGVQAGFAKVGSDLGEDGVRFDHVVLHHAPPQSPGEALLEYADDIGSDLITAGSVHHSRLDLWMVGSVSTELVRSGRRSVLIVPPRRRERSSGG